MKTTNLFFVISLFVCFSCINNKNSTLTQQEKEEITTEVNVVINSIIEGMQQKDVDKAFKESFLDVPEFKYVGIHGEIMSYTDFYSLANKEMGGAKKVEYDFKNIVIDIISRDVAIVTFSFSGTFYFADSKVSFPDCGTTMIFQNKENEWKVIHMQESIQESKFVITEL